MTRHAPRAGRPSGRTSHSAYVLGLRDQKARLDAVADKSHRQVRDLMAIDDALRAATAYPAVTHERISHTPSKRVRIGALVAAAGLLAGLGVAAGGAASADVNLVVNGEFENGTSGWTITSGGALGRTEGHSSTYAAQLTNTTTSKRTIALNDKVNTVASTVKGQTYVATAWVRALRANQSVGIRLMEYAGSSYKGQAKASLWLTDTAWHAIKVSYVAVTDKSTLDLNLLDWGLAPGASLAVDGIALMVPASVASSPSPTPTPQVTKLAVSASPTPVASSGSPTPAASTTPPAPVASSTAPAAGSGWNLAWSDEFSGTAVDSTKWNVRTNTYLSYDLAQIMKENVSVHDGSLFIQARRETAGGRGYTTGYLDTIGKMSRTYGRFEIRAKLPTLAGQSQGLWPAFWLRPDDGAKGEIDIMEAIGQTSSYAPNQTTQTIHYDYSGTVAQQGHNDFMSSGAVTSDWHTYAVTWEPGLIQWYVDGRLVFTRDSTTTPWLNEVFSRNFNIRLNLQVGGSWPGSPTSATQLPQDYQVDYVRVYSKS